MTLYTDQISGGGSFNSSFFGEIRLFLSSSALLAGGGSFGDHGNVFPDGPRGGFDSDGPLVCLSEGCTVGAEFNLVNVNYQQVGDQIVTGIISPFGNVEGQFLYAERSSFPGDLYASAFDSQRILFVGTPVLLGDCNLDGIVDFGDIPSLIQVLQSGDFLPQADCNQDGVVDFADIPRFVAILSNS